MDWALQFPRVFLFTKQPVRDVPCLAFASQNPRFGQNLSAARTSNGNGNGNGRGQSLQKKSTQKGVIEDRKLSYQRGSNSSKSNQEAIISLFKRIQSSISEGDKEEKKNVKSSEDEPMTEALLDVIRLSRKKKKTDGEIASRKDRGGNFVAAKGEVRRARPPSSFTKRSPIPSPTGPRSKLVVPNSGRESEEKALMLENMKLVELKEVAKTQGIKGYSKLKKSELIELLKSSSSS